MTTVPGEGDIERQHEGAGTPADRAGVSPADKEYEAPDQLRDDEGSPLPGTPGAEVPEGAEQPGMPQPGQPSAGEAEQQAKAMGDQAAGSEEYQAG